MRLLDQQNASGVDAAAEGVTRKLSGQDKLLFHFYHYIEYVNDCAVFNDLQIKSSPWFESSKIHPCEKIYSRIPSRVVETQGGEVARDLEGGALRPSGGQRLFR